MLFLIIVVIVFVIKDLWKLHFYNSIYTKIKFDLFEKHYNKAPHLWKLEKYYARKFSSLTYSEYVDFTFGLVDYIKYLDFYYIKVKKQKKELQRKKDLEFLEK